MKFYKVVDQAIELLRSRGRATYRALKREFALDDDFLEDLKEELIEGQQVAVDEVVVRSIHKDDLHTDYIPVGHSTNIAARMEQMATPGSIVVTEYTHNLLSDVYNWFTEGFDTKDLQEAKALLEELF